MESAAMVMVPNTTAVNNGTEPTSIDGDISLTQQIMLIVLFIAVLVFILGGNLLTIMAVVRTPALRTVPNMYVISLAVADFLTGAIIPYYAVSFFPNLQEKLNSNKYLCLCRYALFHLFVAESIACMVVIAFDRFLFIKYPLHYRTITSHRKAGIVIAGTWIASILVGMVPVWEYKWNNDCTSFEVLTRVFRLYGLIPGFFLCLFLTALFYGYIVKTALAHQREALARRASQLSGSSNPVTTSRSDWKSVKVFLLVFGVFVACWFPNFTLVFVGYFADVPKTLVFFTVILGFLNSGMNCIIYAWQNHHFNNAFKVILCGRRRRASTSSDGQTHVVVA
ncbi:octopamine receptor Oamb-like [Haliotis rubra]|uniref:octopamine receptor Oamb-like n=1 Tax=Haliotis rubra TaxID=36100 RepID=UPI001EE4FA25|nr:octopamine receptor Oamb-like [Haliotis rubra]